MEMSYHEQEMMARDMDADRTRQENIIYRSDNPKQMEKLYSPLEKEKKDEGMDV